MPKQGTVELDRVDNYDPLLCGLICKRFSLNKNKVSFNFKA